MKLKRWLWALAGLPLLYLPLAAQERSTQPATEQDTAAAAPTQNPAPAATNTTGTAPAAAAPTSDDPEAASQDVPPPADERYSLDSNLTFPADI